MSAYSSAPSPSAVLHEPVLDIGAGVERLMGDRAMYLRAAERFRSGYRDAVRSIRNALDAADTTLARHLTHTLKGAAGMIEARRLHGGALALEAALRDGGETAPALARLDSALAEVLGELDAMELQADTAPSPTSVVTGDKRLIASLHAMLDIGDGAAVELVAAARSELSAHLGERGYEELSAAMEQFDYELALAILERAG